VIPEETIAQIRERTDVVSFVGEYVTLRRAGTSHKGLCPFHAEKTPSFHVNPSRQMFHCFGCGASGDVVGFLMRIEGIPFPEAARRLAERAGIEMPTLDAREDGEIRRARERKERLTSLMDSATGYFVEQLTAHPLGAMAREAIEKRAVDAASVQRFRLGYAPDGWQGLVDHLARNGHAVDDAVELGLVVRNDRGRTFDRFRHRLMFPICDAHGQVVAFSGRALPDAPNTPPRQGDPPAKYINSPETPLYKKGEILYGLFEGRVDLRRENRTILCEGNFDLVKLHQFGFKVAVAPMGTAFTAEQAKLLRRFVDKAVLLFDGDAAGRKAIRSAFELLSVAGIGASVVALPDGDDPDTFLSREGGEELETRIRNAPSAIAFFVDDAASKAVADPGLRARAIVDLGPIVAAVDDRVERGLWVERIAQRFGVNDIEAVRRQLLAGVRLGRENARGPSNPGQSHAPEPRPAPPIVDKPTLAHELLGAVLDQPELAGSEPGRRLYELLTRDDLRSIFHLSSRMLESRGEVDGPNLVASLAGMPAEAWLRGRLAKPMYETLGDAEVVLRDGVPRLELVELEHQLRRTKESILEARRHGDDARALDLTSHHQTLTRRVTELRTHRTTTLKR